MGVVVEFLHLQDGFEEPALQAAVLLVVRVEALADEVVAALDALAFSLVLLAVDGHGLDVRRGGHTRQLLQLGG